MRQAFIGELVGTFLLVFFGCGAVACSVSEGALSGLFQVAIVWGMGLSVAIYLTGGLSGAHLNPAISLAFAILTPFPVRRLPTYFVAQFLGAFLAAAAVYGLYEGSITAYEAQHSIERGGRGSEATAMIFGEFFPNPGGNALEDLDRKRVSSGRAFFAEFLGTALLALTVFGFTASSNEQGPSKLTPLAIGLALTTLICIFAPVSMAGFNPARDLAPRLFSSLAGWGNIPFAVNGIGWFSVYLLAPCLGALTGGWISRRLLWSN